MKLPKHVTKWIEFNKYSSIPDYVKCTEDGIKPDDSARGIHIVAKQKGMLAMAKQIYLNNNTSSMTREQLEHYTKIYLIQHNSIPSPTKEDIDNYIDESIEFFGSLNEYVKVLQWFFKLN